MFVLQHRVRVFVFQYEGTELRYLLLRQKPRAEWPLGPVIGAVGLDEHLPEAAVREVARETGLTRPQQLLDLAEPSKELFGDVGLVEWPFAFQAGTPGRPAEVTPGPMIGEYAWMAFDVAFRSVEARRDRDALVRLQVRLAS